MQAIPKRVFTHEYRAEAVKLVLAQGLGITKAARKLGLSVKTYSKGIPDARAGKLANVDTQRTQPVTNLQAEVSRLKRELAIAREERDILKKATAQRPVRAVADFPSSPSEARFCSSSARECRSNAAPPPQHMVSHARRVTLRVL